MIVLFESYYNILIFNQIFNPYCFDSFRNKYKKYNIFLISQAEYKIFLRIINFLGKSKKIIKWCCFCETIFENHKMVKIFRKKM